jgi:hypothetical protein
VNSEIVRAEGVRGNGNDGHAPSLPTSVDIAPTCFSGWCSLFPHSTKHAPRWRALRSSWLGVYGFRNRTDHSYSGLRLVNSKSITELAIWDQVAREDKRANIVAVPHKFARRKVNGVSVDCFLTPDSTRDAYTHPASFKDDSARLGGRLPGGCQRPSHASQGVAQKRNL